MVNAKPIASTPRTNRQRGRICRTQGCVAVGITVAVGNTYEAGLDSLQINGSFFSLQRSIAQKGAAHSPLVSLSIIDSRTGPNGTWWGYHDDCNTL